MDLKIYFITSKDKILKLVKFTDCLNKKYNYLKQKVSFIADYFFKYKFIIIYILRP